MKKTLGIALAGLMVLAACREAPTDPGITTETDAAAAAALDQVESQVQAAIAGPLTAAVGDTTTTSRDAATAGRPGEPRHNLRAELAVKLGDKAVDLAARLLSEQGADDEQKRLLEQAKEFERGAKVALEAGRFALAADLAESASHTALKAVVAPRGVSEKEARMLHDVAQDLLGKARDAVHSDPTEVKKMLLALSEQLFREGTDRLSDGRGLERAVVPLWKSAVISSWLIG